MVMINDYSRYPRLFNRSAMIASSSFDSTLCSSEGTDLIFATEVTEVTEK